jgi:septal ring factor EnvC (AmiA/AmiB activator)
VSRRRAALALWLWAVAAPPATAESEERLAEIQRAIEASRARLAEYERRSEGLFEALEAVDRAAAALGGAVDQARAEAAQAAEREAGLETRAVELEQRRAATRRALRTRAVALYKAGEAGPLRVVFSSESLPELLSRSRTLAFLLERDRELLERHREESRQLEAALDESRRAAAERKAALSRLDRRASELDAEREARRRLLAGVEADQGREEAALAELEAAAAALDERLRELSRPGAPSIAGFVTLRGALPAPVDAPVARGFGRVVDREFRTLTFRKGFDFAAPAGEPVRAVAPGEVRFADWFRGYGNMVIVDHGDQYFTVSAHLSLIEAQVGERVDAGQTIGRVGETGSLAGPVLYFEIRRGSEPLDPAQWLEVQPAR